MKDSSEKQSSQIFEPLPFALKQFVNRSICTGANVYWFHFTPGKNKLHKGGYTVSCVSHGSIIQKAPSFLFGEMCILLFKKLQFLKFMVILESFIDADNEI